MNSATPTPASPPPPTIRRRVYDFLGGEVVGDDIGRGFEVFMLWLIVANIVALILETVHDLHHRHGQLFFLFELMSIIVFTLEYVLRLWSVTVDPRYRHPVWGRLRFMITPVALADLISILPFYMPFLHTDLRILRAMRLARIFRVIKLGRYSRAMNVLGTVLQARKAELTATVFVVGLLLLVSSTLMYYVENEAQPDVFSSIPAAMWWGVATLTTIGYGDVYPITPLGKMLGSIVAILGIGVFALPTGILGSAFLEQLQHKDTTPTATICPHCGKEIHD